LPVRGSQMKDRISSSVLLAAVVAELMGCGGARPPQPQSPNEYPDSGPTRAFEDAGMVAPAKHECMGQNACRGQGRCKTSKHTCKGVNLCKGQGGCAEGEDYSRGGPAPQFPDAGSRP
jgi:hypothetical protein